jgi:CDGSH-type Zn-finger protein
MSSEKNSKPKITPLTDGPYMVEGLENLSNRKGPVDAKPKMALCRCGGSNNKPYCDGTHVTNGFTSVKTDDRVADKREDYAKEGITVHDNRGVCAHAGHCTDGLPAVFRLKQEPWIDPAGASAEEIAAAVKTCPSGALSYSVDGAEHRDRVGEPAVFIAPNGPYVVSGAPELSDTECGEGASKEHFTLCRCGGSKNKPFCDGTHWHNKFTDDRN